MTEQKSFVIYKSWATMIANLPTEQAGELIKTICAEQTGQDFRSEDPTVTAILSMIEPKMKEDREKYQTKIDNAAKTNEKRNANGKKRDAKEEKRDESVSVSVSDTVSDSVTDAVSDSENPTGLNKERVRHVTAPKHKHGEYQNVLLSDEEYQQLKAKLGEEQTSAVIEWFSRYIAEKGYKSKSHYLAIKRWVIDAVEERKQKKAREPTPEPEESAFDRTLKRMYEEAGHDRSTGD